MDRRIKVTGTGRLAVRPDTFRLILELQGVHKEYNDALEMSSVVTETLRCAFENVGFKKNALKTLQFDIASKYEGYRDKNNDWKQRFVGYEYAHKLKVEFPMDNARLGKILESISEYPIHPEITIEYTISNPEDVKNELLAKAVSDSKQKAEILANAAGVAVGQLVTIDYSWQEMDICSASGYAPKACGPTFSSLKSIEFEPDDINLDDTVTVIWTIRDL